MTVSLLGVWNADDEAAHTETMEYMRAFMPRSKTRVVLYTDRVPLFSQYRLEPQLDRIYDRQVDLKGGGSIVIDRTEALTAIDVNSGRGSGRSTQEDSEVAGVLCRENGGPEVLARPFTFEVGAGARDEEGAAPFPEFHVVGVSS